MTVTGIPPRCTLAGRILTCAIHALPAGATRTYPVTATVHQVPLGSVIGNCGAVYTTTTETDLSNNASCWQTIVGPPLVPVTG